MPDTCPSCRSFLKKTYWLFLACAILGAFAAIVIYTMNVSSIEARDNITARFNQCENKLNACMHPWYPSTLVRPNGSIIYNASAR
jgi:hypothetical protein